MKPTQEQVIAWAREAGFSRDWQGTWHCIFAQMNEAFTLAYEAGRKDENEACAKVAEESQRTRLTFDAEVIEMVKEAVEMEREACARVCETEGERVDASWVSCAAAIRARGQE